MASGLVPRTAAMRWRRRASCAREAAFVSVMRVSQRSKAMARRGRAEARPTLCSWPAPTVGQASACPPRSLQFDTSPKPILVSMKILQRLLGILPAVVAAAVVEVDEPDALHVDPQAHDRLGPLLHHALLLALGRIGQRVDP